MDKNGDISIFVVVKYPFKPKNNPSTSCFVYESLLHGSKTTRFSAFWLSITLSCSKIIHILLFCPCIFLSVGKMDT